MKDQLLRSEGQRPGIYETTLWKCIRILWLLTIAASFEDGALLKISFPGIGALYGFRVFLALSAVLFAVWVIRYRVRLWRGASALVRWTYIFAAVMIVYGAISLPRAIDFENSIRMLFNLALDMVFFFIMLEVCRDEVLRRRTFTVCAVCLIILLYLTFVSRTYRMGKDVRVFNHILFFAVAHVIMDTVTVWTVNHTDTVPALINNAAHIIFYLTACLYAYEMCLYTLNLTPPRSSLYGKKCRMSTAFVIY